LLLGVGTLNGVACGDGVACGIILAEAMVRFATATEARR